MTTVDPISATDPLASLQRTQESLYAAEAPDYMDKMDFMTLLIAQLEHQDPLNPQDASEFTSELVQFSNLEEVMSIGDGIENLQAALAVSTNTQASALLGKDIVYEGDGLQVEDGRPVDVRFYTDTPASEATVAITNEAGVVVRTLHLDDVARGMGVTEWDGLNDEGVAVADGEYTFEVTGADTAGNSLRMTPLTVGRADGLIFDSGLTVLEVDGRRVSLDAVYSIYQPETA